MLKWLNRSVACEPRHTKLAADVAYLVLDLYAEYMGRSPEVDALVERLHDGVRRGAEIAQQACSTQGMLEMLMAGG